MASSSREVGDESDLTCLPFSAQAKLLILVNPVQRLVLTPWPREGGHGMGLAGGQGSAAQVPTRKGLLGPAIIISSKMLWQALSGFGRCLEADLVVYNTYSPTVCFDLPQPPYL